ncbi:hypothetical protein DFQ26_007576 [Actinomortierella ambigua]|nr:hypothetical protein DFQ26_007576 [Actinomortierella ambigua]
MADVVVYEDSPLAQYLHDLQVEQPVDELQHAPVPVHEPPPPPDSLTKRIADNACGMLGSIVDYLSEAFSSSSSEVEDAEFEERFKYLICTSPFLNRAATLHAHERGRRTDGNSLPDEIEYSARYFSPGRFGYSLGFGSLMALAAHTVLGRTRIGRAPWFRPMFVRPMATGIALATSLWIIRLLRRRRTQRTQRRALRSLQLLVHQCHTLDSRVNRAMMVVQEIELVSRGYRLSTPLAPISRIEQASKTRRCNLVRAQLLSSLDTSSALFQRATETLQSHIDEKRLHTLLDMYNIASSSHPDSPVHDDETVVDMNSLRSPGFGNDDNLNGSLGSLAGDPTANSSQQDPHIVVASPTYDATSPYQAFFNGSMASSSTTTTAAAPDTANSGAPPRRSRNSLNLGRRRRRASSAVSSRPSSFYEGAAVPAASGSRPSSFYEGTFAAAMMANNANSTPASAPIVHARSAASRSRSRPRRHHTSWSSGEESDNGNLQLPSMTMMMMASPRSSIYSTNTSPTTAPVQEPPSPPGMTSLERLRRNYQRMHGHRREFLCELMSIRRKSRKERHGIHQVLKDYDKNWLVAATLLENSVTELETLVNELNKVLDEELYTLPRIDTGAQSAEDTATNKQIQPFVQRLALMEQCVRGIQAKLYICNEDIKDAVKQDSSDTEKQRLLELQFDSISQDIDMISTEWQLGKSALGRVLDPQSCSAPQGSKKKDNQNDLVDHALLEQALCNTDQAIRQVYDALEQLDDPQRLHTLATTQEEVFEASTDAASMTLDRRVGLGIHRSDGTKMTRAERIAYQKAQREQEELLRERSRVTFRMVDELKNVLGQRRHLREGDLNNNNNINSNNNNNTEDFPVTTTTSTSSSQGATGTTFTTTITITATTPAPVSLTMPQMLPPTAYPIAESLASPTIAPSESCYPSDDETPKGERSIYFTGSSFYEEDLVPLDQPMEEITAWTTDTKPTFSSLGSETLHRSSEELQQE